jgi:hypothetical protein
MPRISLRVFPQCTTQFMSNPFRVFAGSMPINLRFILLIGTNTIRSHSATQSITHVISFLTHLRRTYVQFNSSTSVVLVLAFPCQKTSVRFPTSVSLMTNIMDYNARLQSLAISSTCLLLDLHILVSHLAPDLMHLRHIHQHVVLDTLSLFLAQLRLTHSRHVDVSIAPANSAAVTSTHRVISIEAQSIPFVTTNQLTQPIPQSQRRSREALTRRNKRRHERTHVRQHEYVVRRTFSPTWSITQMKLLLREQSIRYGCIPPPNHNVLRILFNTATHQLHAEATLPENIFDANSHTQWLATHPQ